MRMTQHRRGHVGAAPQTKCMEKEYCPAKANLILGLPALQASSTASHFYYPCLVKSRLFFIFEDSTIKCR